MYCWWIEIKESPKHKYYNIRDLSVTSFWYHSNDTESYGYDYVQVMVMAVFTLKS